MFTIQGITGSSSDDANNDATLIGSNGQTYTAGFNAIAGYTNFNNGDYTVSAGDNSVGAVTFQVPVAVTVAKSNGRRPVVSADARRMGGASRRRVGYGRHRGRWDRAPGRRVGAH